MFTTELANGAVKALQTNAFPVALESALATVAGFSIGHPVGPIGGAIFGAARLISHIGLSHPYTEKLLNSSSGTPQGQAIVKTIRAFGSYIAAWIALAVVGFTLAFSHTVSLGATTYILSTFSSLFLGGPKDSAAVAPAKI